ncbi:hypothetical protein GUJ93_ZPchr0006g44393 [Zizania palustris]|uniref:B30.2/SPRY domain-containing protein n=1 Tax=Zizania palustris TaxID=103762 RepID=A0A8J5VHL0_ZIZPA|nr:hypothetical protein GUJ93_ZPchr0006g44393 [Zizania palustris]
MRLSLSLYAGTLPSPALPTRRQPLTLPSSTPQSSPTARNRSARSLPLAAAAAVGSSIRLWVSSRRSIPFSANRPAIFLSALGIAVSFPRFGEFVTRFCCRQGLGWRMVANQEAAAEPAPAAVVDPMRLASRWRSPAEWEAAAAQLEAEPEPSELNTTNSSGLFAVVSTDRMSVKYLGVNQHGHDVGVVQANLPAPTRRAVYYFEMSVKNAGQKGQTSIGFTTENFKMRRQPGWESNSCGYHGDDGYLYRGPGKGESFGPKFTSGDTIGAGINYFSQEFFFTKNGSLVGAVQKEIKGPLYPTIAVHSQDEEVTVNFGKEQFCFDIEGYVFEEKMKQQSVSDKLHLQPDISHWIVRSYLLHYGYQDTLNSFDMASETDPPSNHQNGYGEPPEMYGLSHRKLLRQLIMSGDIDSAFKRLGEWYPQVIKDETSVISFLLHSQRFVEFIRAEQLEDAVKYARSNLANFLTHKAFDGLLKVMPWLFRCLMSHP